MIMPYLKEYNNQGSGEVLSTDSRCCWRAEHSLVYSSQADSDEEQSSPSLIVTIMHNLNDGNINTSY